MQDSEALHQIPDMDWSVSVNITGNIERAFEFLEKPKMGIQELYRCDFKLEEYFVQ